MNATPDTATCGQDASWGSVATFTCEGCEQGEFTIRHVILDARHATTLRASATDEACTLILHLSAADNVELRGVAGVLRSGRCLPGSVNVIARQEALTLKASDRAEALVLEFDCLSMPHAAPKARTDREADRIEAHGACDAVAHALGLAFLAAVKSTAEPRRLSAVHVARALCCHFAFKHAWVQETSASAGRCGLAPWQARKAARLLGQGELQVREVATACRLSASAFSRLFRATFLRSPLAWKAERRIDAVKGLLLEADVSLADAALQAGFSDQASMSRSFRRLVGASPGAWRMSQREGPA